MIVPLSDRSCNDKAYDQIAEANCLLNRRRLGVSVIAPPAGLKAAYRREALKTHPDVNDAPDAEQRFTELSEAYGEHCSCMCKHERYGMLSALLTAVRLLPNPAMHATPEIFYRVTSRSGHRSCLTADCGSQDPTNALVAVQSKLVDCQVLLVESSY